MKPIWKWVIGIVVTLLILVVAGAWYLSRHWKPILDAQIKEAVIRSTDSLYVIGYDDLNFNLITGNASLKGFRLTVDSGRYAELERRRQAPDNVYNIRIGNLRIRSFHPRRILSDRRLQIDDILIDTPDIHIINTYHAYNDTVATKRDTLTLYQRLRGILQEVSVRNLDFNGIRFRFSKKTDSLTRETALTDLNVRVQDILIDSLSQTDTTRFFHTRAIDVDVPGFRYETPDSFYYVSFDRLQLATLYRRVTLTGLKYAPRMGKEEYYRRKKLAKEMAVIAFPTIRLEDVDFPRFVDNQSLHAGSLHIDSGTVAISNDLRYPKQPSDKIGKSPHQLLMKLKVPLKIDSVMLEKLFISYAEVGRKYQKEGMITFNRTQGRMYHVTNDSAALLRDRMMRAEFTTYLMDAGKLDVTFTFDMLDKRGGHTYKGQLGPMNGRPLNRIITPLLNAEVASANIKRLRFDVSADDYRARGTMRFDYDQMRLNLLTATEEGKKGSMKVASFLANSFIINDSNPDANGKYHTARINYARPHTYSFFKTVWQSLLQGIKECAGISPERERKIMNAAEDAKKASEKTSGFFKRVFKKKDRD